jgi:hypothetical protein
MTLSDEMGFKIDTGNRLVQSEQVKHDATVHVASHFARRNLKVSQFGLSNLYRHSTAIEFAGLERFLPADRSGS